MQRGVKEVGRLSFALTPLPEIAHSHVATLHAPPAFADVQVVEDIKCMQIVLEGPGLAIESPASPATRAPPQPR